MNPRKTLGRIGNGVITHSKILQQTPYIPGGPNKDVDAAPSAPVVWKNHRHQFRPNPDPYAMRYVAAGAGAAPE